MMRLKKSHPSVLNAEGRGITKRYALHCLLENDNNNNILLGRPSVAPFSKKKENEDLIAMNSPSPAKPRRGDPTISSK